MIMQAMQDGFPEWQLASVPLLVAQLCCWVELVRSKFPPTHLLDFLELYAGQAELSTEMARHGLACKAFDVSYQDKAADLACHDLAAPRGLRYALCALFFTREAGPFCVSRAFYMHAAAVPRESDSGESHRAPTPCNTFDKYRDTRPMSVAMLLQKYALLLAESSHNGSMG